ncbi:TPA: DUF3265 domain-containing protein [Vibrio vulnificus]|nr:DUF3265 domain-containing protein [Vibrio vulnificus]
MKFKLTNCLRGIRNAWHFQHAVGFVIKLVCGNFAVHCSPLSRALGYMLMLVIKECCSL